MAILLEFLNSLEQNISPFFFFFERKIDNFIETYSGVYK